MGDQEILQKTAGLLQPKGFGLKKGEDGKFLIVNRAGRVVASGEPITLYYAALVLAGDPDSERLQDELPDSKEARQRGLEMGRKLQKQMK